MLSPRPQRLRTQPSCSSAAGGESGATRAIGTESRRVPGSQQPIEGVAMGLGIAPVLKQNGSIVQQRFRTRKLAESCFAGQLPARCGTHKDCRCWIVDGAVGMGVEQQRGRYRWPSPARRRPRRSTEIIKGRLRCTELLADLPPASPITWLKTGVLGNSRQHPGANLLAIMECKDIVRMVCMFKGLVRARLALNSPTNRLQAGQYLLGFG